MCYLTADDVLRINQRLLGHARLRDFGLLEAAMLRPQTTVGGEDAYRDLSSKAAAMFHSLVRNHPFLDGNKRTAVVAMTVMLGLNGVRLVVTYRDQHLIALVTDTAEGLLDVPAIAQRLKRWSVDVYTVGDAEIVFEVDEPS